MGKLFGGGTKPAPPVRMPDPEDPVVGAAEDLARRKAMGTSGRSSTNLTGGNSAGSGGTQAYKNTVLGGS